MAKSVGNILVLALAVSFVRADNRAYFREKRERQWNTPPELTPESAVKMSDNEETQARLFSFIPVSATLSLNTGQNNAHSLSLGTDLQGISLSESGSYNKTAGSDGSSISVSKSAAISAGLSGISTAGAEAFSNGNNAETNSHSLNFGQASATSYGTVENGRATTSSASSAGFSQASSQAGPSNDRRSNRPTLTVLNPQYGMHRPVTWNTGIHGISREQPKPTIHIYKWRANQPVRTRPSLSIEHHESRPQNPRNNQRPTGLHIGITRPQPNAGVSSGYVPGGYFSESHSKGTSGYESGSSLAQAGSFVRFSEYGSTPSHTIPLQFTKDRAISKQSDLFSDLAHSIGELFDIM